MITWQRWTLIAALAATPACDSCSSKTASPAPTKPSEPAGPAATTAATAKPVFKPKEVSKADEGRWVKRVELAEDFAALVEKNAGDCGKLAAAIETWATDNKQALVEEQKRDEELSESAKDALRDRYDERSKKADEAVEKALEPCKDDPAVKKAMDALPDDKG